MSIDRRITRAYASVSGTQYYRNGNLGKIIGLFHLLRDQFDNSIVSGVAHDTMDKKVFIDLSNGNREEIICSNIPDYEIEESVVSWVKEELEAIENKYSLKLFEELPRNQVKGKVM